VCTGCHYVESEVGLGLEKFIGEQETDEALRLKAAPFFKEGKYYEGVLAAVDYLSKEIKDKVK
jgi:uncharacterized membrane protein YgcG